MESGGRSHVARLSTRSAVSATTNGKLRRCHESKLHRIPHCPGKRSTIAEIYLSSNGSPPNSQTTSSSNPHLPATILTPAMISSGPPDATRHKHLDLDSSGEQTPPKIATIDDTVMQEDPSPNVTKGRLSYHLCVECFSQLSFVSKVYTKSAAVADFVYTSESNESCEKYLTQI